MRQLALTVLVISALVGVASVESNAPKHLGAIGHRNSGKPGERSRNRGGSRRKRHSVDHRDGVGGRATLQKRSQQGEEIDANDKVQMFKTMNVYRFAAVTVPS